VTKRELAAKKAASPETQFDVYRDEDADEVEALRRTWELLDELLARTAAKMPPTIDLPRDGEALDLSEPLGLVRGVAGSTREALISCWTQLEAVRTLAGEYTGDFDGEDVLRPALRERLDEALARVETARDVLARYIGPWELPADYGEALDAARRLAERVLNSGD
jgi:hypothetical protein